MSEHDGPVTILFLAADPTDSARLRLGQELRDIRERLQLSRDRQRFILESRESVRPGDLTQQSSTSILKSFTSPGMALKAANFAWKILKVRSIP